MSIRVHDTLSGERKEFVPVNQDFVGMYVCGVTVQGKPHVGHMRAAVSGDIIRRTLKYFGYNVIFLNNFTDVDDKIIERARQEGCGYSEIAKRNIAAYMDAIGRLNIMPATHYPCATQHMSEIQTLIERLIQKDVAYATEGDVYFRVGRFAEYGKLSRRRIEDLRTGTRIDPTENKESPLDFALWKAAKEGEPFWETPWGRGRPGWHIECSAMAMKYLGDTIDFHGGGLDLIFPHHENEIAQSEAATGKEFSRHWVHNGLVTLGGEKMSKSTNHVFLIEELLERVSPDTVRFYLMSTHYRSPIEFSEERLAEAGIAFGRLQSTGEALQEALGDPPSAEELEEPIPLDSVASPEIRSVFALFLGAIQDDFNTAKAQGHLFELCRLLNRFLTESSSGADEDRLREGQRVFHHLGDFLGLNLREIRRAEIPAEVLALARERTEARAAKDWARADEIRDALTEKGYVAEDRDGETVVRPV